MKIFNDIKLKKIVHVIFFMFLPLCDLFRNVGTGEEMMLATQGIGLIIALILITHYGLRSFFKFYNLIWVGFGIGGIYVISKIYANLKYSEYYQRECWLICVNFCLLGMIVTKIVIDSIKAKENYLKKIKAFFVVNNLPFFLWLGYILIATLTRENIYRPGCELIYFGLFFLVSYSEDELHDLYNNFLNGVLIGFWILQGYAFLRRPWVDTITRYRGLYFNSNIYDIICLLVMLILLVKMTNARREKTIKNWQYYFWLLQYGMVFSLIIISVGRFSVVLAFVGTIVYGIVVAILERDTFKNIILHGVLCILCVSIMLPFTSACASYLPRIAKSPVSFQNEYFLWGDLNDSDNYVSMNEFIEYSLGRLSTLITNYEIKVPTDENGNVVNDQDVIDERPLDPDWQEKTYFLDEENYNSVDLRVAIGLTYLVELNMWGHTTDEWWLWVAPHEPQIHPHNIFIMEAFVYGIPAGILFIAYIISCFAGSVRGLKYSNKKYQLFLVFAVMQVVSFGIFEMNWQPGQISWFTLLFITKFLLQTKDEKDI